MRVQPLALKVDHDSTYKLVTDVARPTTLRYADVVSSNNCFVKGSLNFQRSRVIKQMSNT